MFEGGRSGGGENGAVWPHEQRSLSQVLRAHKLPRKRPNGGEGWLNWWQIKRG